MNKKGFTLIELLAVIVILAVIALIATPIILGIIDDAKKGAFEESARNTVKAAEHYYATSNLKSIDAEGVCYVFNYSSDVTEKTLIEEGLYQIPVSELDLGGKKVTDGKVTVCGTYSEAELSDGAYTYVLRRTGSEQILKGSLTENDLSEPIIDSIEYQVLSGTSIKVNVTAHEEDAGEISKYYYSIDGINYTESSEAEYTIEDLTLNTEYKVYVQVSNKSGLKASGTKDVIIVCAYEIGQTWEFTYKESVEEFEVPCTGTYKLEVWGGQGQYATGNTYQSYGGLGGYSSGNYTTTSSDFLYIAVGGGTGYTYNGGGYSVGEGGNGGGATHIATTDRGVLANYTSYQSEVLIVAGGAGGGGASHLSGVAAVHSGGAGGGLNGGTQPDSGGKSAAGTQTSGYAFGQGENQTSISAGAGGGGGWYGGYAGGNYNGGCGGGGGSAYLSEFLTETSTTAGVNSGNGKAVITLISF